MVEIAKKARVHKREVDDLIDIVDARDSYEQDMPKSVTVEEGRVRVEYGLWLAVKPFGDSELFTSFARLAAWGSPSEAKIASWVSQYGLPVRGVEIPAKPTMSEKQKARDMMSGPGWASWPIEEIRKEAQYAHDLFDLYLAIRAGDTAAIKDRLDTPESRLDREFGKEFDNSTTKWLLFPLRSTPPQERDALTLAAAQGALGEIITVLVSEVRLRTGAPRQQGLVPAWECPDLLSAMYLQFYFLVTRNKPIRYCESPACEQAFVASSQKKRFCNDTCRSNARHERHRTSKQ